MSKNPYGFSKAPIKAYEPPESSSPSKSALSNENQPLVGVIEPGNLTRMPLKPTMASRKPSQTQRSGDDPTSAFQDACKILSLISYSDGRGTMEQTDE